MPLRFNFLVLLLLNITLCINALPAKNAKKSNVIGDEVRKVAVNSKIRSPSVMPLRVAKKLRITTSLNSPGAFIENTQVSDGSINPISSDAIFDTTTSQSRRQLRNAKTNDKKFKNKRNDILADFNFAQYSLDNMPPGLFKNYYTFPNNRQNKNHYPSLNERLAAADQANRNVQITDRDKVFLTLVKLFIADTTLRETYLKDSFHGRVRFASLVRTGLLPGDSMQSPDDENVYENEFMDKKTILSLHNDDYFGIMLNFNGDAHFEAAHVISSPADGALPSSVATKSRLPAPAAPASGAPIAGSPQKKPFLIRVYDPSYPDGLFWASHITHDKLKKLGMDSALKQEDLFEYPGFPNASPVAAQKRFFIGDSFCQSWSLMYLKLQNRMIVPSYEATAEETATVLLNFFRDFFGHTMVKEVLKGPSVDPHIKYWEVAMTSFQDGLEYEDHFDKKSPKDFFKMVNNFDVAKLAYILRYNYE